MAPARPVLRVVIARRLLFFYYSALRLMAGQTPFHPNSSPRRTVALFSIAVFSAPPEETDSPQTAGLGWWLVDLARLFVVGQQRGGKRIRAVRQMGGRRWGGGDLLCRRIVVVELPERHETLWMIESMARRRRRALQVNGGCRRGWSCGAVQQHKCSTRAPQRDQQKQMGDLNFIWVKCSLEEKLVAGGGAAAGW